MRPTIEETKRIMKALDSNKRMCKMMSLREIIEKSNQLKPTNGAAV